MSKPNSKCSICPLLGTKNFQIYETKYWSVTLCNDQVYLGRSYVTLKRHCESLPELTNKEWADLKNLIAKFENTVTKAFGAENFNWSCLMNDAFNQKPAHPHVHWHVRPRYSHEVKFQKILFTDLEFGHHYARGNERQMELKKEQLKEIAEKLKKFF